MKTPQRDLGDALKRSNEHRQQNEPEDAVPKQTMHRPPSRIGKTQLGVYLHDDAHLQLKTLALEQKTSLQALGIEAVNLLFKLNNKPPIAK